MKYLKTIFFFSCMVCLIACNNQNKNKKEGFQFEGDIEAADIDVTKSFIYLFPSPGDILDRFYEAELTFDASVLHEPALKENYVNSRDKGLNLGIYLTDMAYTALFTRSNEAVDFLDAISKLSSDLNVSTATFETLIDRAKNNVGNSDSLMSVSNEVFFNMIEFLETSGKESTIAVISCGAYVESMFLALNSIDIYRDDHPIIKQITELRYPMENLLSHAESTSDDPNVQSILKYIQDLNELFADLESESSSVTKSEPGVLSFSGGSAPELNEGNFEEMKAKVIEVRNYIIGK